MLRDGQQEKENYGSGRTGAAVICFRRRVFHASANVHQLWRTFKLIMECLHARQTRLGLLISSIPLICQAILHGEVHGMSIVTEMHRRKYAADDTLATAFNASHPHSELSCHERRMRRTVTYSTPV